MNHLTLSLSVKNIEDISWPRRDTNFIFDCTFKYLSRVNETNELEIISAREDKIRYPQTAM